MNNLSGEERRAERKRRQKMAALKAWETIREKEREEERKRSRSLEEFVAPHQITRIKHPELLPSRVSYGRGIVHLFEKTPPQIACGRFWELRWAFGCPFNCSYCYLRGTTRGNMKPSYVNPTHVLKTLDEAFGDPNFNGGRPTIFNSGELCDSLMNPRIIGVIADKFEEQCRHRLLILTKSGAKNIRLLVKKRRRQTICAWSINAPVVAERWETAAAHPSDRIKAAKIASDAGYDIRIRIDPVFPIHNWRIHYGDLIYAVLSDLNPQKIIVGTPRGLWKTIRYARRAGVDMSWTNYFSGEETGWGKKLPEEERASIYQFFHEKLDLLGYPKNRIAICKETISLLKKFDLPFRPGVCQCYSS